MTRRKTREFLLLSPLHSPNRVRRGLKGTGSPRETTTADLMKAWDRLSVPPFHRAAFTRLLDSSPRVTAAVLIERETEETVRKKSAVVRVMDAIARREALLGQIGDMGKSQESEHILRLDVQDALRSLQEVSLDVVSAVSEWREELRDPELPFLHQDRNYFHKMQTDLCDLRHTSVGRFIPEGIGSDPLLVNTLSLPLIKGKAAFRAAGGKGERLRRAVEMIEKEPQSPVKTKVGEEEERHSVGEKQAKEEDCASLCSTLLPPQPSSQSLLCSLIFDFLMSELASVHCYPICLETCLEWQSAHLILHSNKILDDIISLALRSEISVSVYEAYTEEIDREFIAFQKEIMETVIGKEIWSDVDKWILEVIAEQLAEETSQIVEVDDIVAEAIAEETHLNAEMRVSIFTNLLNEYMAEEWMELLCENVFSDEIMEDRLKDLPAHVIARFIAQDPQKFINKQAEYVFREFEHEYISGTWLIKIATAVVCEENGFENWKDEEMMPIEVEEWKKPPPKPKGGLYKW